MTTSLKSLEVYHDQLLYRLLFYERQLLRCSRSSRKKILHRRNKTVRRFRAVIDHLWPSI